MAAPGPGRPGKGTPEKATPITLQTPTGRELAWDWGRLALYVTVCIMPLAGSWLGTAVGLLGLLAGGYEGLRLILQTAHWRRAGHTTLTYDWGDAIPGGTVAVVFTSSRRDLPERDWTVQLSSLQVRRRHGIREETPLWEGPGRIERVEATPTGSRMAFAVTVPTPDDVPPPTSAGVVDWQIHLVGAGPRKPLTLTFDLGVHEPIHTLASSMS
jgi:hypothetical protein